MPWPTPSGYPTGAKALLSRFFCYRNIFRSKWLKKASHYTHAKGLSPPRTPPSIMVTMVASS